jgi:predicted MFS family arabinose efflux permease
MAFIGAFFWLGVWANTRSLQVLESRDTQDVEASPQAKADFRALRSALISYFLYGLGYIAYMTFLVAYVRSLGASPGAVSLTWTVLGSAMFASAFVWRRAFERESGGRTLALMGAGGALSAALPLFSNALPVLLLSAALFGLFAMPIFTAVTVLIRRHLPPSTWTSGIALATVTFATGQSLGPLGSGWASDHFGPRASLLWTCGLMLLAAAVALTQKRARS